MWCHIIYYSWSLFGNCNVSNGKIDFLQFRLCKKEYTSSQLNLITCYNKTHLVSRRLHLELCSQLRIKFQTIKALNSNFQIKFSSESNLTCCKMKSMVDFVKKSALDPLDVNWSIKQHKKQHVCVTKWSNDSKK